MAAAKTVFKVFVEQQHHVPQDEVRRIQFESRPNFEELLEALDDLLSGLAEFHPGDLRGCGSKVKVQYFDEDGDKVTVGTDPELQLLLDDKRPVNKIYVIPRAAASGSCCSPAPSVTSSMTSPSPDPDASRRSNDAVNGASITSSGGVLCACCHHPVLGFRYRCLLCQDYDLCSRCEARGLHPGHEILRMPLSRRTSPYPPDFFAKLSRLFRKVVGKESSTSSSLSEVPGGGHDLDVVTTTAITKPATTNVLDVRNADIVVEVNSDLYSEFELDFHDDDDDEVAGGTSSNSAPNASEKAASDGAVLTGVTVKVIPKTEGAKSEKRPELVAGAKAGPEARDLDATPLGTSSRHFVAPSATATDLGVKKEHQKKNRGFPKNGVRPGRGVKVGSEDEDTSSVSSSTSSSGSSTCSSTPFELCEVVVAAPPAPRSATLSPIGPGVHSVGVAKAVIENRENTDTSQDIMAPAGQLSPKEALWSSRGLSGLPRQQQRAQQAGLEDPDEIRTLDNEDDSSKMSTSSSKSPGDPGTTVSAGRTPKDAPTRPTVSSTIEQKSKDHYSWRSRVYPEGDDLDVRERPSRGTWHHLDTGSDTLDRILDKYQSGSSSSSSWGSCCTVPATSSPRYVHTGPSAGQIPGPPQPAILTIAEARQTMLAMGFSDDDGWLTQLLRMKNGDIEQVIDVLTPVAVTRK